MSKQQPPQKPSRPVSAPPTTLPTTLPAMPAGVWPALAGVWARVGAMARMPRQWWTHSLRVRLALWYGALLALVVSLFGVGVYLLMSSAIQEGSQAEIRAESRVALAEIRRHLTSTPPYWPDHLTLEAVDANRQPGVSVVVLDHAGHALYSSEPTHLLQPAITSPLLTASLPNDGVLSRVTVSGERLLLLAVPVYAPAAPTATGAGQVVIQPAATERIGTLLVAKSLRDANAALATLSTLLVIGGALAIACAIAGGGIIARSVLRPLAEVTATAGSIATDAASGAQLGNLTQRVRRPRSQDELAQLVDTFNSMLDSLERATAAQRRFVQDASHELRVPLTIVQGNLTLLLEQAAVMPPDERRELLTAAQEETVRLTGIVNELLALARADSARDASPTPSSAAPSLASGPRALVDLDRIILDLTRRMRLRLVAEQNPVSLKISHIEPVQVRGNEEALRKVGLILLDNAVKYTPAQDAKASISVSLERHGDQAVLQVRDTGIGIQPSDLAHIFDRLYRADIVRDRQGSGLGLAIAKAIVEQHGGAISAESVPNRGSTFTIRLPLASAATPRPR